MDGHSSQGFEEINRFNAYAQENPAEVASLLSDADGLDGIVGVARDLRFQFTVADVKDYIREKAGTGLSEEQLALISGGDSTHAQTNGIARSSGFASTSTFVAVTTIAVVAQVDVAVADVAAAAVAVAVVA